MSYHFSQIRNCDTQQDGKDCCSAQRAAICGRVLAERINTILWASDMVEVDIQTISIAVASAGVFVAATYYALQIRHQTKIRQMDLLMRLYIAWGSEDMKKAHGRLLTLDVNDYDSFVKQYGEINSPNRSPVWVDIDRIGWFINGVGFLVAHNFVNVKLVDDLWGYGFLFYWKKLGPLIVGWRKRLKVPEYEQWFEYLVVKIESARRG